jgi:Mrp family chromosome partitioning ATPase
MVDVEWHDLDALRRNFGFILLDCPALRESSQLFSVSRLSDGVVLVVAAGQAQRSEIQYAQYLLEASSVTILGLVLNRRIDPVPKFISSLF